MDNGTKWMYLNGHVGYGDWHHQIADQLAARAGVPKHDAQAISNYALVNAIPAMEGHDLAWGHLHHNIPVIWNTNLDRSAVDTAVRNGIGAADRATADHGGRAIGGDSLDSSDYNQNGGNVAVASFERLAMPWMDQSDPESWQDDPDQPKKKQRDFTELQPKPEHMDEDWSDPHAVLRQHLSDLANEHGVGLKYWGNDPSKNKAYEKWNVGQGFHEPRVKATEPISPQHYMSALHEFGHLKNANPCIGASSSFDEDWNEVPLGTDTRPYLNMYYKKDDGSLSGLQPRGHAQLENEAQAWKWAAENSKLAMTPAMQKVMHRWMNSYIPKSRTTGTRSPESVYPVPPTWKHLRETYPEGRDIDPWQEKLDQTREKALQDAKDKMVQKIMDGYKDAYPDRAARVVSMFGGPASGMELHHYGPESADDSFERPVEGSSITALDYGGEPQDWYGAGRNGYLINAVHPESGAIEGSLHYTRIPGRGTDPEQLYVGEIHARPQRDEEGNVIYDRRDRPVRNNQLAYEMAREMISRHPGVPLSAILAEHRLTPLIERYNRSLGYDTTTKPAGDTMKMVDPVKGQAMAHTAADESSEHVLPTSGQPWHDEEWQKKQAQVEPPYGDSLAVDWMHLPISHNPERGTFVGAPGQSHMLDDQAYWTDTDAGIEKMPYEQRGPMQGNVNVLGNSYTVHWPEVPMSDEAKLDAHQQIINHAEEARKDAWERYNEAGGEAYYQQQMQVQEENRIRNLKRQRKEMFHRMQDTWLKDNPEHADRPGMAFVQSPEWPALKDKMDNAFPEIRNSKTAANGGTAYKYVMNAMGGTPIADTTELPGNWGDAPAFSLPNGSTVTLRMQLQKGTMWVVYISVKPERQGVGTQVMNLLKQYSDQTGLPMQLIPADAAKPFYDKFDWLDNPSHYNYNYKPGGDEMKMATVFGNQAPWYLADGVVIVGNFGQTAEEIGWEDGMIRGTLDTQGQLTCHSNVLDRQEKLHVAHAVEGRYKGAGARWGAPKDMGWWVEGAAAPSWKLGDHVVVHGAGGTIAEIRDNEGQPYYMVKWDAPGYDTMGFTGDRLEPFDPMQHTPVPTTDQMGGGGIIRKGDPTPEWPGFDETGGMTKADWDNFYDFPTLPLQDRDGEPLKVGDRVENHHMPWVGQGSIVHDDPQREIVHVKWDGVPDADPQDFHYFEAGKPGGPDGFLKKVQQEQDTPEQIDQMVRGANVVA